MNDYQLQLECDLALKRVMARVDEIIFYFEYPLDHNCLTNLIVEEYSTTRIASTEYVDSVCRNI